MLNANRAVTVFARWPVLLLIAGAFALTTCTVTFADDLRYSCREDSDCGADWRCTPQLACCQPNGDEVCDGVDNDCDGTVDNSSKQELCNGADDDCDGRIDENFDLVGDVNNCGRCGNVCPGGQVCSRGACMARVETNCSNDLDDDGNGATDCADQSCDMLSCGAGCSCRTLTKTETNCGDGKDNDGDGAIDCLDVDCNGQACLTGCTCRPDGGQLETGCSDGADNDHDSVSDCADPDCLGKLCTDAPVFFTCASTSSSGCKCNGGLMQAEKNALCGDHIDNDCDGLVDCADSTDCPASSVCHTADGGTGSCSAAKACE